MTIEVLGWKLWTDDEFSEAPWLLARGCVLEGGDLMILIARLIEAETQPPPERMAA